MAGVLSLVLLATPLAIEGQPSAKVFRIGWLSIASPTPEILRLTEAFIQGLRDLGYVEGQNLVVEYRYAEGRPERLPELAADLPRLKVDVIVAPNPAGAQAAKRTTKTVPIVMLYAADPVGSGLVASLARPGGNITGLAAFAGPELTGKLLDLLRELVHRVTLVAVLRNPTNPDAAEMSKEVERVARALGMRVRMLDVRLPSELDSAFAAMARARAGGLLLVPDAMFFLHRQRIARLAVKSKPPTVTGSSEMAEAGFLMSYGPNLPNEFRRGAMYVDRILRGAKPAELPVEQPTTFELVINLKTANALGVTVPRSLLLRADRVIEE